MDRRLSAIFGLMLLTCVGCSSMNADIDKKVNEIKTISDIQPYIQGDITYTYNDSNQYNENLTVVFNVNNNFSKLEHNEKVDLLNKWRELLKTKLEFGSPVGFKCGDEQCDVENVLVYDDSDEYKIEIEYGESITLNGEAFERKKSEEELFAEEINSDVDFAIRELVMNLYMLSRFGYPFDYTMNSKHNPSETYSIANVKKAGQFLADTMKKTGNQSLIEASARVKEKTDKMYELQQSLEPIDRFEMDKIVSEAIEDMRIIIEAYPASIGQYPSSESYYPVSYYLEELDSYVSN